MTAKELPVEPSTSIPEHMRNRPHINAEGKFQSDKYPTCPPGKVPLSVTDETAQDLDAGSYAALKNRWMRCRVEPNDTAGKIAAAFHNLKAS